MKYYFETFIGRYISAGAFILIGVILKAIGVPFAKYILGFGITVVAVQALVFISKGLYELVLAIGRSIKKWF